MTILGKFPKQPSEVLDYDVDFTDWFAGRGDTPSSISVVVDAGLTVVDQLLLGLIARVVLSGGVDDVQYKVTVRMTTTSGMIREADFVVSVKED